MEDNCQSNCSQVICSVRRAWASGRVKVIETARPKNTMSARRCDFCVSIWSMNRPSCERWKMSWLKNLTSISTRTTGLGGRQEKGNGAKEIGAGSSRTTHSRILLVRSTQCWELRGAEDRPGRGRAKEAVGVREGQSQSIGDDGGVSPT